MTAPDHAGGARGDGAGAGNLKLRIASAAVLAPLVLAITYVGGWLFVALCAVAAGGIFWEWTKLVARRADVRALAPGWLALAASAALIGLRLIDQAWVAAGVGTAIVGGVATARGPAPGASASPAWPAAGLLYASALLFGPALLRSDPQWGFTALLFLFAIVWATDILAYFCGRAIGGPLLWPAVSPRKTWAGAVGGLGGGLAAGVAVAYASGVGVLGIIGVMALVLSVLAQAGDLFESAVKRHFGAKDASHLIPGHGGLMDRLDGFLFAAFAALLVGMLRQGVDAPARGLLVW